MSGWVAVDFDGTLARYDGWRDGALGEPVEAMARRVRVWLAHGVDVRILTARVGGPRSQPDAEERIAEWCRRHLGQALPVTCEKDYRMTAFFDDRAVTVQRNTGIVLTRGVEIAQDGVRGL